MMNSDTLLEHLRWVVLEQTVVRRGSLVVSFPPHPDPLPQGGEGTLLLRGAASGALSIERVCGDNPTQMSILMGNSKSIQEET
jgi:hypothetical protein